jgi:hypothetical protein
MNLLEKWMLAAMVRIHWSRSVGDHSAPFAEDINERMRVAARRNA